MATTATIMARTTTAALAGTMTAATAATPVIVAGTPATAAAVTEQDAHLLPASFRTVISNVRTMLLCRP
jgi:hypothetical protein